MLQTTTLCYSLGVLFFLVPFMKTFKPQPVVIDTIFGPYTPEEISILIVILTFWIIMLALLFIFTVIIYWLFGSSTRTEISNNSNDNQKFNVKT